MLKVRYIKTFVLILVCTLLFTGSNLCTDKVTAQTVTQNIKQEVTAQNNLISPLLIVKSPSAFLNKNVEMKARFDKFSTLGLDYKSAFKSSEEYISFLIKRDDTSYDIPLSEMKLFLKRNEAEKHIDLKTDDEILIKGQVFSDALGDAWVDVENITVIKKAPEKKNGV